MRHKAFTFLELMLVITIMVTVLGLVAIYSQTSQVRADVNTQAADFVSYARLASSDAMSGKGNQDYGIHLEADSYTLFEGSAYSEVDPDNYEIELPGTITIQNISLNGGGSDLVFDRPFGDTKTYGSFDLTSDQIGKTITITIDQYGKVSY